MDPSDSEEEECAPTEKNSAADALAAAFGIGGAGRSDVDSESVVSETASARKRNAYNNVFQVKGVDCVACALGRQLDPVTRFVKENIELMSDHALWRHAALKYQLEIYEPRAREGVVVPKISYKDLRTHYLLHSSDEIIARATTCRQLQTARLTLDSRLIKVENGERELDSKTTDLLLKVIKQESAERSLLHALRNRKNATSASTTGDK
jgi:hypothetical protein